jgi:hypothetical protein
MVDVRLTAVVGDDRKLVIDLPDDIPPGEVEVVVRPRPKELTREEARRLLAEAGLLSTWQKAPEGYVPLTPEELLELGTLPPGSRSSEELIDEDRGEY